MTPMDEDTRLKLLGLKVLAMDLYKQSQAIAATVKKITGEVADNGWSSDYVWDDAITPEIVWERTAKDREAGK